MVLDVRLLRGLLRLFRTRLYQPVEGKWYVNRDGSSKNQAQTYLGTSPLSNLQRLDVNRRLIHRTSNPIIKPQVRTEKYYSSCAISYCWQLPYYLPIAFHHTGSTP